MLELQKIYKNYQVDNKPFPALKDINLCFADKGFVSILGPSGCGKTTLLNLIGGLDQYNKGDLLINGKSTKQFSDRDWDAYRNKRVGFVFQNYNLVPHLTILANVELSLTLSGMSKRERLKTAANALANVGLKSVLKKKPNQLSGGQMQRVAIARALVNNPEIILADEPTGALDTHTSIQVLDLLEKVAKNRLVIMVTHNEELAKRYSTRIIKLRDGRIINDSHPIKLKPIAEDVVLEKEKNKQTHMSFFTALSNSFRNLLTKKGRTIMTSVAASFGIIGVALVLAMSNGFTNYVNRVEMSTASSVPITISPFVTTSIQQIDLPPAWPSEEHILPYSEDISQLLTVHRNELTKEFSNYCKGLLSAPHQYASSVLENHEYFDFNIFTERPIAGSDEKKIIKVNQFLSAGAGGAILSGTTALPSTIFHEFYGDKKYIDSLYEVIKGEFPRQELYEEDGHLCCDVALICDRYNRIPLDTLYALGLSATDTYTEDMKIDFNDLIGHEYHAYMPNRVYEAVNGEPVHTTVPSWQISKKTAWEFEEGDPINKDLYQYLDVTATKDDGSYRYLDELKALYGNVDKDTVVMKIKSIIRMKRDTMVNLMPGSICYPEALKNHYLEAAKTDTYKKFADIARDNWCVAVSGAGKEADQLYWQGFVLNQVLSLLSTRSTNALIEALNSEMSPVRFFGITKATNEPPLELEYTSFQAFQRNNYRFSNDFLTPHLIYNAEGVPVDIKMDELPDGPIDVFNYITGYSTITSVLIFPKDLSSKQQIFNYINEWNVGKEEEYQIQYSDLAGTLTDALGTMIDIISIVLICFSAVSLLVSCVMTGVITYTSVLERTKEIGILRAIGARKKDVGRLFEAESVIIGGVGGLIGVLFTFIVEWPISLIINTRFPEQQIGMICNLSLWHALILIAISILLTFVAGFIPARKAAKKDPVVALRTE